MTTTADPRAKLPDTPLSGNEALKDRSDYLHGTIKDDLTDDFTGGFTADNFQLIRFHGMYEQDNRDIRAERTDQKLEPLKNMMLRCRLPGGIITPAQWLGIDEFAGDHTIYGSIRLTNRQTFQYHGILKTDLKLAHQSLHKLGLDSIATASDVNRNVLCTSNPVQSPLHQEAYEWAKRISMHLLPRTRAYADVWLDGEKVFTTEPTEPRNKEIADDVEPILGKTYLPRKFKTAVVIPPDNDVDIHSNDLGFVAIEENGKLRIKVEGKEDILADKALLSIGRVPDLEGIGDVEFELDRGRIKVNEYMETSVPGIYAPGDINGTKMLAHAAFRMGEVAAENALKGNHVVAKLNLTPAAIYTLPEVAAVGLTEEQAREKYDVAIGKFNFAANGRAIASDAAQGFVKVIADKKYGEILGVHIIGPAAAELINEASSIIEMEITVEEMLKTIHGHPTYSEVMYEAFADVLGMAIHSPKKK